MTGKKTTKNVQKLYTQRERNTKGTQERKMNYRKGKKIVNRKKQKKQKYERRKQVKGREEKRQIEEKQEKKGAQCELVT